MTRMEVEIKIYAPFSEHTDQSEVRIALNTGSVVGDAVRELLARYPALSRALPGVTDQEGFLREVLLLKGQTIVMLDSSVESGDRLHMLPAIVSG